MNRKKIQTQRDSIYMDHVKDQHSETDFYMRSNGEQMGAIKGGAHNHKGGGHSRAPHGVDAFQWGSVTSSLRIGIISTLDL